MMKRLISALAILFSGSPWAMAQGDFDRGFGDIQAALAGLDVPQVSASVPDKGWFSNNNDSKPLPVKEWTVMVFMNGKNDLEVAGLYNLNKMEMVGSNDSLNIVTETGRMKGQQNDVTFDGNWTGSRRFYITADSNEEKVKSKAVQKFDKVDMGDWRQLADFGKWAKKNYPARHYALIVWNHGSGWVTTKGAVSKGISYDFETKNHISTPELGAAMREIGKVDILGYDACLMQMAELLYEVNGYADYVVGSEETVPGLGFPYDTMLPSFTANRNSEAIVADMIGAYDGFYASKGKAVTLSAVRMSALPDFMTAFNSWTDAILASDKKAEIKGKALGAKAYAYKDNKDLYEVARLAAEIDPQGQVAAAGRALQDSLTGKLIIRNMAYKEGSGRDAASHGLAIYLPAKGYDVKYDQLAWAGATRWDELLKELKGVEAPTSGSLDISGCVKPGPNASVQELMAYADCLIAALSR